MIFLSPGVKTEEIDYSAYVGQISTCIVGMVGSAIKGPVGDPLLCTSPSSYIEQFGIPFHVNEDGFQEETYYGGLAALEYLKNGNQLYYVRVTNGHEEKARAILNDGYLIATAKEPGTYGNDFAFSLESNPSDTDPLRHTLSVFRNESLIESVYISMDRSQSNFIEKDVSYFIDFVMDEGDEDQRGTIPYISSVFTSNGQYEGVRTDDYNTLIAKTFSADPAEPLAPTLHDDHPVFKNVIRLCMEGTGVNLDGSVSGGAAGIRQANLSSVDPDITPWNAIPVDANDGYGLVFSGATTNKPGDKIGLTTTGPGSLGLYFKTNVACEIESVKVLFDDTPAERDVGSIPGMVFKNDDISITPSASLRLGKEFVLYFDESVDAGIDSSNAIGANCTLVLEVVMTSFEFIKVKEYIALDFYTVNDDAWDDAFAPTPPTIDVNAPQWYKDYVNSSTSPSSTSMCELAQWGVNEPAEILVPYGVFEEPSLIWLTDGQDGVPITPEDIVGRGEGASEKVTDRDGKTKYLEAPSGLQLFKDSDELDVNIICAPGFWHDIVSNSLIELAESKGDILAVLEPPQGLTVQKMIAFHNGKLKGDYCPEKAFNSSYACIYWPWVQIYDIYSKEKIWVPPAGVVCSQFAYSDNVGQPWFATAGLKRGVLKSVYNVERKLNLGDRDALYGNGNAVNPIINYKKYGIVIWGQRTLQRAATALDRINVRRLMNYIKRSIAASTDYIVFEQNDPLTWRQWIGMIDPFMRNIKDQRGVYDYAVVMDETTVTDYHKDRNEMPGQVWVKPTKVAEFIPISFILTTSGASFGGDV